MKHPQFSSAYVMIISWTKHDLFSWNIFFLLDLRLYRKMCDSIEVSRVKILDALVIGKFNEAVEVTNLPLCPLKYNHLSISRFTTISFRWPMIRTITINFLRYWLRGPVFIFYRMNIKVIFLSTIITLCKYLFVFRCISW